MLYKTNNESRSFMRWFIYHVYFHSVKEALMNRTFSLSRHENICTCTMALITIHYLYIIYQSLETPNM